MKKILLIPPVINPYHEGTDNSFMPLGLLSIAAILKASNYHCSVYSPQRKLFTAADYRRVAGEILSHDPGLVGFSTWCISYPSAILVAGQIKNLAPSTPVIFGGPQASLLARETLMNFPYIDFVLAGETDHSFLTFLKMVNEDKPDWKKVPGLSYHSPDGNVCTNPACEPVNNLDDLPVPAYEYCAGQSSLNLDVGRGCPFKCTFCTTSTFFSKIYRLKSPGRILYEMEIASSSYKINRFSFAHDLFTLNKKRIDDFCDKLIELKHGKGQNYSWTCSARIDYVDNNLLPKMKQAGCESIFFGIESGSPKIQKSICKNLDIEKAYEVADTCRKAGLQMYASFIAGFPDETEDDLEATLQCALKLFFKAAFVQFSVLSLLPGTPLFNQFKDDLKLDGLFSNFSNASSSPAEYRLIRNFPLMFSSFYYLPVNTLGHSSMHLLCRLINLLYHFRNTIFMLQEIITEDLNHKKLLPLVKAELEAVLNNGQREKPVVSHVVNLLERYLHKNRHRIGREEIFDVFQFEAFQALLIAQLNFCKYFNDETETRVPGKQPYIKPVQAWRVLSTSYRLPEILPGERHWELPPHKIKKRKSNYLIIAISSFRCLRHPVTKKDVSLLSRLKKSSVAGFIRNTADILPEEDARKWLSKMEKLGVLQIISES